MRTDRLLALLDSVDFHAFPNFENNTIRNLGAARKELLKLTAAPELAEALSPLLESRIFATDREDYTTVDAGELRSAVYRLQILIIGLREALQYHAPSVTADSVVFKLPDPADLADALRTVEQFRVAVDQVIANDTIGGHVKLVGWETGSFWLYVALGTPAAVSIIGSIAWSAAVVRKKFLEGTIIKKKIEAMEIRNEALEAVREGVDRQVALLLSAETKAVYDKHFRGEEDPEQLQRLQYAIKTFAELIGRGAEVHPSLEAPEAVANLFPDAKKLNTIASTIAQLTDKASDSSESGAD
jgi:hypothetical protein